MPVHVKPLCTSCSRSSCLVCISAAAQNTTITNIKTPSSGSQRVFAVVVLVSDREVSSQHSHTQFWQNSSTVLSLKQKAGHHLSWVKRASQYAVTWSSNDQFGHAWTTHALNKEDICTQPNFRTATGGR